MTLSSTPGVATSPSGALQTQYNFISEYDYAMVYEPDKLLKLHPRYGNGSITGFCMITGSEKEYASDVVKHSEQGRLHQITTVASVTGKVITTTEPHNLRVHETIAISDGVNEYRATVSDVDSATVFTAENRAAGAFSFEEDATIQLFAYGSDFAKGSDGFNEGKTWKPEFYENYTQILKEKFIVPESDMAHISWVKTDHGDMWYTKDANNTRIAMQNYVEMTHIIGGRSEAGSDSAAAGYGGMIGIAETVSARGNVGNGYITTLDELDEIGYRLKQQGCGTVYTVWCDQKQMTEFSNMLGGVNSHFSGGANYGVFQNNPKLALYLDFHSFVRGGITYHLTPWKLLDDPTLLGASNFLDTNIACMFVPAGQKMVQEDGKSVSRSYLNIRYRAAGGVNRKMRTKVFGIFGSENLKDRTEIEYISEQTNQVVGANEWLLVNR